MSSFAEKLYEKKSFIYKVGNDYYAIGVNTFTKVTDSPEVDNIELLENALNKNNERQIVKYLEKISRIANTYRVDGKEHFKLQDRLIHFTEELEKNDVLAYNSLQEQVSKVDELMNKYV